MGKSWDSQMTTKLSHPRAVNQRPLQLKLSPGKDFSWKGLTVVQTTVRYQDHSETKVKVVD